MSQSVAQCQPRSCSYAHIWSHCPEWTSSYSQRNVGLPCLAPHPHWPPKCPRGAGSSTHQLATGIPQPWLHSSVPLPTSLEISRSSQPYFWKMTRKALSRPMPFWLYFCPLIKWLVKLIYFDAMRTEKSLQSSFRTKLDNTMARSTMISKQMSRISGNFASREQVSEDSIWFLFRCIHRGPKRARDVLSTISTVCNR